MPSDNLEEKHDEVIVVLRKSRKAFFLEYICGIVLLLLVVYAYFKKVEVPPMLINLGVVLGVLSVGFAEIDRLFLRYIVTEDKISIINGIIKQSKKNVHFLPLGFVPDINLKQNYWQRFFDYGTIFMHGSGESSFEIKDIDHPEQILKMLEELMEQARNRQGADKSFKKPKGLLIPGL